MLGELTVDESVMQRWAEPAPRPSPIDAAASHAAVSAYHQIAMEFHLIGRDGMTPTEIRDRVESIIAAECRKRMAASEAVVALTAAMEKVEAARG